MTLYFKQTGLALEEVASKVMTSYLVGSAMARSNLLAIAMAMPCQALDLLACVSKEERVNALYLGSGTSNIL